MHAVTNEQLRAAAVVVANLLKEVEAANKEVLASFGSAKGQEAQRRSNYYMSQRVAVNNVLRAMNLLDVVEEYL